MLPGFNAFNGDHTEFARTEVELGVEVLRARLAEAGLLSRGAWRARVARRAKEVRALRPITVAPGDLSDPALSGLLKGLAIQQEVTVIGLTPAAGVDAWLREARMGPGWSTASPSFSSERADAVSALFSEGAGCGGLELLEAGDEVTSALEVLATWRREGVETADMALVMPAPTRALAHLEERAAAAGLPLVGRLSVGVTEAPLGQLARVLAADPESEPAHDLAVRNGVDLRLIGAVRAAPDALSRVMAIARLLQRTALGGDRGALSARDLHLGEGLIAAVTEAAELEPPPDALEIVDSARGRIRILGDADGVAVVGYPDTAALGRDHIVCLGLAAGQWPPRPRPTPFASARMIVSVPALRSRDRAPQFASALCAARRAVLIRQARDGQGRRRAASLMWIAAESAGAIRNKALPTPGGGSGAVPRAVREASERARIASEERREFGVDEIAAYMRCPLGWFASTQLFGSGDDPERRLGEAAHAALRAAFDESVDPEAGPDERAALAAAELARASQAGSVSATDAEVLLGRCQRVIERYGPADWPFRTLAVERPLRMVSKDDETVIVGRVDRIDETPDGPLVIDYKLNRATELQGIGRLIHDAQAILYPLLVDRELETNSVGVLFVSLARGDHDGLVRTGPQELWGPNVMRDSSLLRKPGVKAAMEAITGMREGRIERSPYCPMSCACRRLPWGAV